MACGRWHSRQWAMPHVHGLWLFHGWSCHHTSCQWHLAGARWHSRQWANLCLAIARLNSSNRINNPRRRILEYRIAVPVSFRLLGAVPESDVIEDISGGTETYAMCLGDGPRDGTSECASRVNGKFLEGSSTDELKV
ncbi:hypothetical protein OG21DRAFT_699857 [Imleria badia]|nr:hypothetical protein OG21DRAFT_699857 [Imleria badia]